MLCLITRKSGCLLKSYTSYDFTLHEKQGETWMSSSFIEFVLIISHLQVLLLTGPTFYTLRIRSENPSS